MSLHVKTLSIIFILFLIIIIIILTKKDKITIKYSIAWLMPCMLLLILTIMPGFLTWTTKFLGFQVSSNMVFSMLVVLLMVITIALTVIVSNQKKQLRNIIQEVSILKAKNEKK